MLRHALAAFLLAAAQTPPDFSGYWQLDRARSEVDPSTEMAWLRVQQSGTTLVATLRVFPKGQAEENQTFVYALGATGSTNTMHGAPMTSDVAWQGEALDIRSVATFDDGPLRLHETWELSKDGRVLRLTERSRNVDDPERRSVFTMLRRAEADWPEDRSSAPAETQYRNIQALKGLPASRLPVVMREFARSLGVSCTHCHVSGHFDQDEKAPKRTARAMLGLVARWNADAPVGQKAVSCWSCHRGSVVPD